MVPILLPAQLAWQKRLLCYFFRSQPSEVSKNQRMTFSHSRQRTAESKEKSHSIAVCLASADRASINILGIKTVHGSIRIWRMSWKNSEVRMNVMILMDGSGCPRHCCWNSRKGTYSQRAYSVQSHGADRSEPSSKAQTERAYKSRQGSDEIRSPEEGFSCGPGWKPNCSISATTNGGRPPMLKRRQHYESLLLGGDNHFI